MASRRAVAGRLTRTTTCAGRVGSASERKSRAGARDSHQPHVTGSLGAWPPAAGRTGTSHRGHANVAVASCHDAWPGRRVRRPANCSAGRGSGRTGTSVGARRAGEIRFGRAAGAGAVQRSADLVAALSRGSTRSPAARLRSRSPVGRTAPAPAERSRWPVCGTRGAPDPVESEVIHGIDEQLRVQPLRRPLEAALLGETNIRPECGGEYCFGAWAQRPGAAPLVAVRCAQSAARAAGRAGRSGCERHVLRASPLANASPPTPAACRQLGVGRVELPGRGRSAGKLRTMFK